MALPDISGLTQDELMELINQANVLYSQKVREAADRERVIAEQQKALVEATAALATAAHEDGAPWAEPQGVHNSYMKEKIVTHDGKTWISLIDFNAHAPGLSGWREVPATPDAIPAWVQPAGSHDAYDIGDKVTYDGKTWICILGDASGKNSWKPGEYGWEILPA